MARNQLGFTLIELLLVIAILGILFVVVIVNLDPLRQFREAKNAARWSHVNSLATAIYQYVIEQGNYPEGIDGSLRQIGTAGSGCGGCGGAIASCLDLSIPLKRSLPLMPVDPAQGTSQRTGYAVTLNSDNVIMVVACHPDNNASIMVLR